MYSKAGWFEIWKNGVFWDYRYLSEEDLKKIATAKKHKWDLYPDY